MSQKLLFSTAETDLVRNIPLFSGLAGEEMDALLKEGSLYSYPRKKALFRHGDPLTHFYVICAGSVRLFHEAASGCEITTDILMAGDAICVADIFSFGDTHNTHAEALSGVTAMEFPAEWLRKSVQDHPRLAVNLLSALSQQTHKLKTEAGNLALMSAAQLAACFLQKICISHGFNPREFSLPYSKSLIASRLGMKLETLSRALPRLKEMGIAIEGRRVAFRDLPSMERSVCEHCPGAENCHARKILHRKN